MLDSHFQLPVNIRSVQQILSSAEYCGFEKRKKAPFLTPAHRASRLNLAENSLESFTYCWRRVVSPDEKRFLLD